MFNSPNKREDPVHKVFFFFLRYVSFLKSNSDIFFYKAELKIPHRFVNGKDLLYAILHLRLTGINLCITPNQRNIQDLILL